MKAARFTEEAQIELREAAAWYKDRSKEVARRFLADVRATAHAAAKMPLRFPIIEGSSVEEERAIRRALLTGFPYALVFVVVQGSIRIIAVAHQHRMPGYWLHRLQHND